MAPSHDYRVKYYDHDGAARILRPKSAAEDTPEHMDFMLEHYVESGISTGGHIEEFVRGFRWVVFE
jgi:hypothetical protein